VIEGVIRISNPVILAIARDGVLPAAYRIDKNGRTEKAARNNRGTDTISMSFFPRVSSGYCRRENRMWSFC